MEPHDSHSSSLNEYSSKGFINKCHCIRPYIEMMKSLGSHGCTTITGSDVSTKVEESLPGPAVFSVGSMELTNIPLGRFTIRSDAVQ